MEIIYRTKNRYDSTPQRSRQKILPCRYNDTKKKKNAKTLQQNWVQAAAKLVNSAGARRRVHRRR